jgi:hypothetical protein
MLRHRVVDAIDLMAQVAAKGDAYHQVSRARTPFFAFL